MGCPGDYYDKKRQEARKLSSELEKAKEGGSAPSEIKRLEKALEMARFVGD